MIIIPAIDLRGGKCVRLRHGDVKNETVYSDDPVSMAKKWVSMGAQRLHVVDLDGAISGEQKNLDLALRIKKEANVAVQLGGGVRSMESIAKILDAGIDRVIIGTIILEEAGLAKDAFDRYGSRIMAALDVRDGKIATRGWKTDSGFPLEEGIRLMEKIGVQEVVFTDISRDGTLEGVNTVGIKNVMSMTKMSIIASGGVGSMADIQKLTAMNVPACIVGKAIYDGKLDLIAAIKAGGN
jgi:phosphoribosylformimino-5-aminoimidazole carboxamide ribotide isomerase